MRNFMIWALSLIFAFQPAAYAQGNAQQMAEIKAFLEKSQVTRKPVTLKELYNRTSDQLPASQKQALQKFLRENGNRKLPKFNVSKVKSGNKDIYQLQGIQDGQSLSLEIIGDDNAFVRINGKTLTAADFQSVSQVMAKAGVPASDVQSWFGGSQSMKVLSAEQVNALPPKEKALYFKQLRELLASMEAVQHAMKPAKSASALPVEAEVALRWLLGDMAQADAGGGKRPAPPSTGGGSAPAPSNMNMSCVAAGYMIETVGRAGNQRWTCGTDGKDGVAAEFRKSQAGMPECKNTEFRCNPMIYASKAGCSPAGRDTTETCNKNIKGNDIPDLAENKADFDRVHAQVFTEAARVMQKCAAVQTDFSKMTSAQRARVKGLEDDQVQTCERFRERFNTVKSWNCNPQAEGADPHFEKKYPKICANPSIEVPVPVPAEPPAPGTGADGDKPPVTGPAQPAEPPTKPPGPAQPQGPPSCDNLPIDEYTSDIGVGGSGITCVRKNTGYDQCQPGNQQIFTCKCDRGTWTSRSVCSGSQNQPGSDSGGHHKPEAKKEISKWWLIGAAGLIGLLGFHYMAKKTVQKQTEQLEPLPQLPPLPAPVTEPTPRGVN